MGSIVQAVRRMKAEGHSERSIADHLGVTRHAVRKAAAETEAGIVAIAPDVDTGRSVVDSYVDRMVTAMGRSSRLSVDTVAKKKNAAFGNIAMISADSEVEGDSKFESGGR